MNATLITAAEQYFSTTRCVYSAAEAADKLGVSEKTIRKVAKSLGVTKIAGPTVAGFIRFEEDVPVTLAYHA